MHGHWRDMPTYTSPGASGHQRSLLSAMSAHYPARYNSITPVVWPSDVHSSLHLAWLVGPVCIWYVIQTTHVPTTYAHDGVWGTVMALEPRVDRLEVAL